MAESDNKSNSNETLKIFASFVGGVIAAMTFLITNQESITEFIDHIRHKDVGVIVRKSTIEPSAKGGGFDHNLEVAISNRRGSPINVLDCRAKIIGSDSKFEILEFDETPKSPWTVPKDGLIVVSLQRHVSAASEAENGIVIAEVDGTDEAYQSLQLMKPRNLAETTTQEASSTNGSSSTDQKLESLYERGKTLRAQKKFAEALAQFRIIESVNPRYKNLLYEIGATYERARNLPHHQQIALDYFDKAIQVDDKAYYPLIGKGEIYFDKGDRDNAFAMFSKAALLQPDNANALYNLALVESDMTPRDYTGAITHLQKAVLMDSKARYYNYQLALCYQATNDATSAKNAVAKELELNPTDSRALKLQQILTGASTPVP